MDYLDRKILLHRLKHYVPKKLSKSFIEEILTLESELYMEESVEDITRLFAEISNSRWTTNAMAIRTCFEDEFRFVERSLVANGYGALSEEEISNLCNADELNAHLERVNDYFQASSEGFESPPLEKRGTDLRESYSYLQRNSHCMTLLDEYMEPSLGSQVRLIYFDYIVSNFMNQFGSEMQELEEAIAWYNELSTDDIPLPLNLEQMTRREINHLIHKLQGATYVDYIGVNTPTFGMEHQTKSIGQIRG